MLITTLQDATFLPCDHLIGSGGGHDCWHHETKWKQVAGQYVDEEWRTATIAIANEIPSSSCILIQLYWLASFLGPSPQCIVTIPIGFPSSSDLLLFLTQPPLTNGDEPHLGFNGLWASLVIAQLGPKQPPIKAHSKWTLPFIRIIFSEDRSYRGSSGRYGSVSNFWL
jgi:hypothetical protein